MSASLRRVTSSATVSGWTEVADRCFVRRYPYLDVSCTVVIGGHGPLVVDTRASLRQGRELAEHVRVLTPLPVQTVVNTHVHFDHLFGNGAFPGVPILAHDSVPSDLPAHEARTKALYAAEHDDPEQAAVLETPVVAPTATFASVLALDLGARYIELAHLGRGHTAGDVVVRVPDADLVCAGDLVEESAHPSYGPDCHPMEWGSTLASLSDLLGRSSVVVPGHGRVVDKDFVLGQRLDVVEVAEQISDLVGRGLSVDEALHRGRWPFPAEHLRHAVARGMSAAG